MIPAAIPWPLPRQRAVLPLPAAASSATTSPTDVRAALSAEGNSSSAVFPPPDVLAREAAPHGRPRRLIRGSEDPHGHHVASSAAAVASRSATNGRPRGLDDVPSRRSRGLLRGGAPPDPLPPAASSAATCPRPSSEATAHSRPADAVGASPPSIGAGRGARPPRRRVFRGGGVPSVAPR